MIVSFAKILIFLGSILIFLGLIFLLASKVPFLGKLPGDILYRKENFVFYFPITTCILISILISLIVYLIFRFFK